MWHWPCELLCHHSPHRNLHTEAFRYLHNGGHSTADPSSKNRSCPPVARCSYSTQSMQGARVYRNLPARRKPPAHPSSWAAGTGGMTVGRDSVMSSAWHKHQWRMKGGKHSGGRLALMNKTRDGSLRKIITTVDTWTLEIGKTTKSKGIDPKFTLLYMTKCDNFS